MEEKYFVIYITPEAKSRPRFTNRGGHVIAYTDSKTRQYENSIKEAVRKYAPFKPFDGSIEIETVFYKKKPKSYPKRITKWTVSPDLDNMQKALWDAFNGIFWKDDAQVISSISSKMYSDNDRIEVKIYAHKKE